MIESDSSSREGDNGQLQQSINVRNFQNQAEKRAHHNALERKRRDHIKGSFSELRDAVPLLKGEKASRAHVLKASTDYIRSLKSKNQQHQKAIEDFKRQNAALELQTRLLERVKETGKLVGHHSHNTNNSSSSSSSTNYQQDLLLDSSIPVIKTEAMTLNDHSTIQTTRNLLKNEPTITDQTPTSPQLVQIFK
ncbi:unnamed protein product [Didymodactylos carnosus]|uniref:BHLH domain-containing protein n=1 Tax=Didymodactylos carnosus TaxID=1234261 RepID=A0A813SIC4_9BILA|nr:unnamed protein product [Didymodactylos carnosus]CAF0838701.1 unnamed protein product [Didymodactylos carnosus]CAF3580092.1 unnamed protein product [Didymodactylos carnosus]CAF3623610.1 unnamed protein product [Didymodactylos carnosus]